MSLTAEECARRCNNKTPRKKRRCNKTRSNNNMPARRLRSRYQQRGRTEALPRASLEHVSVQKQRWERSVLRQTHAVEGSQRAVDPIVVDSGAGRYYCMSKIKIRRDRRRRTIEASWTRHRETFPRGGGVSTAVPRRAQFYISS